MTEQQGPPAERPLVYSVGAFGGLNVNDDATSILLRSHTPTQFGWVQRGPAESPAVYNVQFTDLGVGTRKGSTESDDASGVLGGTVIGGHEWRNPASGARIKVRVTTSTILTKQSGSWAVMKVSDAGADYAHVGTAAKCTFAEVDGHLIIAIDSTYLQVYRSGANLDDQLRAGASTTTVDASSASGQKVLNVAATTALRVGDRIIIDEGSAQAGEEEGVIMSISASVSVTLATNLTFTHSNTSTVVAVQNLYTEAYDSNTTHTVTGTWPIASYLVAGFQGRLTFSTGEPVVRSTPYNYTGSSGIWDLAGAGTSFFGTPGRVLALATQVPEGGAKHEAYHYAFCSGGLVVRDGMEEWATQQESQPAPSIVSHNSWCVLGNLVYYMSDEGNIWALSGRTRMDIGRRMKSRDDTGPLTEMDPAESSATSFALTDDGRKQAHFYYTTANGRVNDGCLVVDTSIGAPRPGEPEPLFEQRVRIANWTIADPDTNDWFVHGHSVLGGIEGLTSDGKGWTINSGALDLDTHTIDEYVDTGWFTAGSPATHKEWLSLDCRFKVVGDWELTCDVYLNYASTPSDSFLFKMTTSSASLYGTAIYGTSTYTATGVFPKGTQVYRHSTSIKFRFRLGQASKTFDLAGYELRYLMGGPVR